MDSDRQKLDADLAVTTWWVPGQQRAAVDTRDPDAPYWWVDEEEASQSFLKAMGVNL